MDLIQILEILFFVVWFIIGVGAIFLLVKVWRLLRSLEFKILAVKKGLTEANKILSIAQDKKDVVVPLVSALLFVKKWFEKKKGTKESDEIQDIQD